MTRIVQVSTSNKNYKQLKLTKLPIFTGIVPDKEVFPYSSMVFKYGRDPMDSKKFPDSRLSFNDLNINEKKTMRLIALARTKM